MAYENGYDVREYIDELLKAYEKDQAIFNAVYAIIPIFTLRTDWPHCYDEMDHTISRILGNSLTSIIFGFTSRYLNDDNMEWPEEWEQSFLERFLLDLQIFHKTFENMVYQYGFGRSTPMKVFSVSNTYDRYTNTHLIRISRFDGTTFEFQADEGDISGLIRSLQGLEKNE